MDSPRDWVDKEKSNRITRTRKGVPMRHIKTEEATKNEIKNWLKIRASEWYSNATESEISLLIMNLCAIKNIDIACEYFERTVGKKPDDDIAHVLLLDWIEYVLSDLIEKGTIEEAHR
jgi:hypothetical protein